MPDSDKLRKILISSDYNISYRIIYFLWVKAYLYLKK